MQQGSIVSTLRSIGAGRDGITDRRGFDLPRDVHVPRAPQHVIVREPDDSHIDPDRRDEAGVDFHKLEESLTAKDRLSDIAALARALTYGEMVQFAYELLNGVRAADDISLKVTTDADVASMAAKLHAWSGARQAPVQMIAPPAAVAAE